MFLNKILHVQHLQKNPHTFRTLEEFGKGDQSHDHRNQGAIQPGCSVSVTVTRVNLAIWPAFSVAQVSRADTAD